MKAKGKTIDWPVKSEPRVLSASSTYHEDRKFQTTYCSQSFYTLHFYDYHASMRLGNMEIKIVPGDITLTPVSTPSSYDIKKGGRHIYIHFATDDSKFSAPFMPLEIHFRPQRVQSRLLRRKFMDVVKFKRISEMDINAEVQTMSNLICHELLLTISLSSRENYGNTVDDNDSIRRASQYLDDNLEKPLDVPMLSRHAGLSQNYLAKLFRLEYGMTMKQYLMRNRIEMAKFLLSGTNAGIKDIAQRVGIQDIHFFYRQFRGETGMSPGKYRKGS